MRQTNITILSIFLLLLMAFLFCTPSWAGDYLDSAHGNDSYGVDRTSMSHYPVGHCGHCHEQHASVGGDEPTPTGGPDAYMLFAEEFDSGTIQTDNFCFKCHTTSGSLQSGGGVTNYSYSYKYGGCTEAGSYDSSIKEQFSHTSSTGSSHYLPDFLTQIVGQTLTNSNNESFTIPEGTNPCNICHNVHVARRQYPVSFDDTYLNVAMYRFSRDEVYYNERFMNVSPAYQAPYYRGSTTTYEPAGDTTSDGSNMPRYVRFCNDCHNQYNTIYSTNPRLPDGPRNLTEFKWMGTGDSTDAHGRYAGGGESLADCDPPYPSYTEQTNVDLILSCTDCHEPHGSKTNIFLLRSSINGQDVSCTADDIDSWRSICAACHDEEEVGRGATHFGFMPSCRASNCHQHGAFF